MNIRSLESSDHRERLLEVMADSEHSPFYTEDELILTLGLGEDRDYFGQLASVLKTQHEITYDRNKEAYVLPERTRELPNSEW